MTRTKRPRKKSSIKKEISRSFISNHLLTRDIKLHRIESEDLQTFLTRTYESSDHLLEEFSLLYEAKVTACKEHNENICDKINSIFEETIKNLPETYLNLNIYSYYNMGLLKIGNLRCNVIDTIAPPSRGRKPDVKTFEFKRPITPRLNRSSSRKRSVSAPPPMATPSSGRFKTPSQSLSRLGPMSAITLKVAETPMCVMRRPERGEVAFAATGSPLLVGRVSLENIPTVSVPLQDGRIFSILPDPGAAPPSLPEFDEETKRYLKTLRQHLELLAPSP